MLFLFILLFALGLIVIVFDAKKETNRWASMTAFAGSAGGLSVVIEDNIRLSVGATTSFINRESTWLFTEHLLSFISHYVTPYSFLVFSIVYSNRLIGTWKKHIKIILLTPILIMAIFFPIYPQLTVPYAIASLWVTPYILCGIALLVYAFIQEQHRSKKRQHLLVNLAFIPTITFGLMTNYILRSLNIEDLWRYNYWIVFFATIVFIIGLIGYGFMGLKLQVQRQEYLVPEVNSGTALLNYVIKNDIKAMIEIEDLIKELENLKSKDLNCTNCNYLSQLIFNWAERERKKLASDIHDSFLQDIIIVKRKIEEVKLVTLKEHPNLENKVTELEEEILDIVFSMRETCQELAPPHLEETSLENSLKELEEKFKLRCNSILTITVVDSPKQLLNSEYKLVVYRIVQELLNNAIKHSEAAEVTIFIQISETELKLSYQDNGVGTDLSLLNTDQKRIGLIGMAGRVHSVGGQMNFNSKPNEGMNVEIDIPLKVSNLC
ncbi:MAG: ATP-binding protein [Anaerobacillus sp.]|uniref:sensor histidine kinase n=1 Tax=Anaerobacillus sp. TaxID=1872506 RepID=UPI00391DD596